MENTVITIDMDAVSVAFPAQKGDGNIRKNSVKAIEH